MNLQEYIENLSDLGLTQTEAKVYIVLLVLGRATANSIHKESNIARQEVYRLLSDLEEKGLIERTISKPTEFRSIPIKHAIEILLQRKRQQVSQIEEKAIQQFRNFEIDCINTSVHSVKPHFVWLSKNETSPNGSTDKIGKAVYHAKESVVCLTTFSLYIKVKSLEEDMWKQAVRKGVKFRFIVGTNSVEEIEFTLDPMLMDTDYFEIRRTPIVPPASILLIDENEVFYRMGIDLESPVLWSSASSFVKLIKDYFESKWKLIENTLNQNTYL